MLELDMRRKKKLVPLHEKELESEHPESWSEQARDAVEQVDRAIPEAASPAEIARRLRQAEQRGGE